MGAALQAFAKALAMSFSFEELKSHIRYYDRDHWEAVGRATSVQILADDLVFRLARTDDDFYQFANHCAAERPKIDWAQLASAVAGEMGGWSGLKQDGKAFLVMGSVFFPVQSQLTIGRAWSNHIVIHEEAVSRVHAEIALDTGAAQPIYLLRDRGSGTGTLVNGQRIGRHRLEPEDVIEICGTKLEFVKFDMVTWEKATEVGDLRSTVFNEPGPASAEPPPRARAEPSAWQRLVTPWLKRKEGG